MRNDELEQLVIQRTSQLEAANKELSIEMEIRKKAEEKLLKKHDNFLKIFSAVPVGLLLLDSETVIVDANQAIYSMIFREPTEVIGRRAGDGLGCIHSFETDKDCGFSDSCPACPLRHGIEQIIADSPSIRGEELNLNLMINGKPEERCLSVSAEPIEIDGHLHVIVAIDDITDRKEAEKKLKKSVSLVTATLESTVDGILVIDKKRKVRRFNNRFVELWRISDATMSTGDDETLLASVLDQLSEPESFLKKVEGLYLTDNESFDVVGFKDGRIFEFYSRPQELDGENIGRVWSFRDVTKRMKAEEALKVSKRQLEELNATKDKLFSIIGHDLRSPIGGLKQLIELTLSTYDLSDTQSISEILETIQKSASATYDLLENLLAWAQSQKDDVVFMPTHVNLYEIIDACILLMAETARSKNISIYNQTLPNQLIYADQNMLMTILRNLLTNAIKFTQPYKKIYLSAKDNGIHMSISVRDEGVGINLANLDKLFKSNSNLTTFGTSGEKGTGLGLLLCKELIEKHGGKVWVESEVGKGSDFKFTIPLN